MPDSRVFLTSRPIFRGKGPSLGRGLRLERRKLGLSHRVIVGQLPFFKTGGGQAAMLAKMSGSKGK